MFDIGFLELMLIGVIGLLVLGPERLPTAARTVGLWLGKAKRIAGDFTREVDRQLKADEMRKRLREEGDELGLEKIQQTVNSALSEAKQFERMVSKTDSSEIAKMKSATSPTADGKSITPDTKPPSTQSSSDQKPI